MGLQAPSELERQKQQEDINLSRVQQDTGRIQQSIYQQKMAEEQAAQQRANQASEYYLNTLQNPNATPEELQRAEDAVSYINPEFGKIKEIARKNQSALVSGFGKESAFGLYNAIRSNDPELIASEFDRYQTAAESRPELKIQAQVIRQLRNTYQKNPTLALGMARNAAFSSDPTEYKKVWDAEKAQQEVEGVGKKPVDKDTFDQELKLAKEYESTVAPYQKIKESYGAVLSADKSPVGKIALIYAYMKMLDPGSVVREGEFATAQNAAGVPDRIRNMWNKAVDGEGINDDQVKDIISQSKKLYETAAVKEKETRKGIEKRAKAYGLDPERIFNTSVESVPQPPKSAENPKPTLTPYNPTTVPTKESAMRSSAPPANGGNLKSYQDASKKRLADSEAGLPVDNTPVDLGEPKLILLPHNFGEDVKIFKHQ